MLFYKAASRKNTPRWRGPAKILDIVETAVTVKFRSQTFKVVSYRVQKKAGRQDVGVAGRQDEAHGSRSAGGPCFAE